MTTLTQILLGLVSSIPALFIAYLAYRGAKKTAPIQAAAETAAAAVAAEPNAQAQINAGFQMLLQAQGKEIRELRTMVATLFGYTEVTSNWHVDHVQGFDNPAKRIIELHAPHELPGLIIELKPFVSWEEYRRAHPGPHPE